MDPLFGKLERVCNICGLAWILGLTSSNRLDCITSKEGSGPSELCFPTRVGRRVRQNKSWTSVQKEPVTITTDIIQTVAVATADSVEGADGVRASIGWRVVSAVVDVNGSTSWTLMLSIEGETAFEEFDLTDWCCFYYFVRNSLAGLCDWTFFRFEISVCWHFSPRILCVCAMPLSLTKAFLPPSVPCKK